MVTLDEFARQLQVPLNQPAVDHLFGIFATSDSRGGADKAGGAEASAATAADAASATSPLAPQPQRIDMRAYRLCAAFLETRERPLVELLRSVCAIYATDDSRLTLVATQRVLRHVLAVGADQSEALFRLVRVDSEAPTIGTGELIAQLQRMSQYRDKLQPAAAADDDAATHDKSKSV